MRAKADGKYVTEEVTVTSDTYTVTTEEKVNILNTVKPVHLKNNNLRKTNRHIGAKTELLTLKVHSVGGIQMQM